MKPLLQLEPSHLRGVKGLLFDVDGTVTTHGRLTVEAYAAMQRAKNAGLIMVPITGACAGWCDQIARLWPVDGVVGENGAFYMSREMSTAKLTTRYIKPEHERAADRVRLDAVAREILKSVPGAALAADQGYRAADLAIDHCVDVPPLPAETVSRIQQMMHAHGLNATVSSVHVNGWLGDYGKLSTTRVFLAERFGIDLDARKDEFIFVGDSPNDAPMFAHIPLSIGVANVHAFAGRLPVAPQYVTRGESGAGFAEVVEAILAARP